MSVTPWNHNIHYHDWILAQAPSGCRRALDLGCGTGLLLSELSRRCDEVVGVEQDHETWQRAESNISDRSRVRIVEGDALTYPFEENYFGLITAVAVLHHMPFLFALERVRGLLAPGGVFAAVGLYRPRTVLDFATAIAAMPVDWSLKMRCGYTEVGAPIQAPRETLREIKAASALNLPGAEIRRRLLYRYTLYWCKPL